METWKPPNGSKCLCETNSRGLFFSSFSDRLGNCGGIFHEPPGNVRFIMGVALCQERFEVNDFIKN
jgi:hypothetical protein